MFAGRDMVQRQIVGQVVRIGKPGNRRNQHPIAAIQRVLRFLDVAQRVGGSPLG
jgi:hypothetical protein